MNTKAKHTPGPWEARWGTVRYAGQQQHLNRCVIGTPKNERGASFVTATITGPFAGEKSTAEANAALIAAAPDLLAACQRALAVETSTTQGQERELRVGYLDVLRAAITKGEA